MGDASRNAIALSGLTKRYGAVLAVDGLDLAVPRGSILGLIGPNGSGKTSTIRMMMGIVLPDAGAIDLLGCASAVEARDRVGYLPEERGACSATSGSSRGCKALGSSVRSIAGSSGSI
jgi:ABC-2 type transport system ATP-binding protein